MEEKSWLDIYESSLWRTSYRAPSRLCLTFETYHLRKIRDRSKSNNSFYESLLGEVDGGARAGILADSVHVLDLGCGDLGNSVFLLEMGYRVTGVDIFRSPLVDEVASRFPNSFTFVRGSSYDIPCATTSFDAVIADGVLYYSTLDNFRASLRELNRVIRSDGMFRFDVKHISDVLFSKLEKRGLQEQMLLDRSVVNVSEVIETQCSKGWESGLPLLGFTEKSIQEELKQFRSGFSLLYGFDFFNYVSFDLDDAHKFMVVTGEGRVVPA